MGSRSLRTVYDQAVLDRNRVSVNRSHHVSVDIANVHENRCGQEG